VDSFVPWKFESLSNIGVVFLRCVIKYVEVYSDQSLLSINSPCGTKPRACTILSGIRSWSKCIIFSLKWKSSNKLGPRSPTVNVFSSSLTLTPLLFVIALLSLFFSTFFHFYCFLLFNLIIFFLFLFFFLFYLYLLIS